MNEININNNIPKEWINTQLNSTSNIIMGQSPSSSTYNSEKIGLPFYQGKSDFGDLYPTPRLFCSEPKKIVEKNNILISVRAPVGPTNLSQERSCIGRGLAGIDPIKLNISFVLNYLRYCEKNIEKLGTGTTFKAISKNHLENLNIPLPPLLEQNEIVNRIESLLSNLDAGVESFKKTKEQINTYKQSVLKWAFLPAGRQVKESLPGFENGKYYCYVIECKDGSLYKGFTNNLKKRWDEHLSGKGADWTRTHKPIRILHWESFNSEKEAVEREKYFKSGIGRERLKDFQKYNKNLKEGELPRDWRKVNVFDVGEIVTGTTPSKKEPKYYGNDFPFYKPADLDQGYYTNHSEDNLSTIGIKKARLLPIKSILVTCIGATIGKTGFIRKAGASNQQINTIIPNVDYVQEFVYYYTISKTFQDQIINNASSTTLPILNKTKFEKLQFIKPPLSDQQAIVSEIERRFSAVDKLEEMVDESLEKAKILKQSILKKAFNGELTEQWREEHQELVTGENSAERLLEKIREEKNNLIK